MKTFELYNDFVKIELILPKESNLLILERYLGNYIKIENKTKSALIDKNVDFKIFVVNSAKSPYLFDYRFIKINDKKCYFKTTELYVDMSNLEDKDWLFLKRLIIDIVNRLVEQKQGRFFHASSVVYNGESIMFVGEKGTGKTTAMLYTLLTHQLDYSSNERTAIIKHDDIIKTYGNPARINIRAETFKTNKDLKEKFETKINFEAYEDLFAVKHARDCSERIQISFEDISKALNVKVEPVAKLKAICNFIFDPDVDFKMEKVELIEFISELEKSSIDGVYTDRKILNDLIEVPNSNLDTILSQDENINCYNVKYNHTLDFTHEIINTILADSNVRRR